MTKENQKTDLGYLSQTWHERLVNIRTMAKESQKNNIDLPFQKQESGNFTKVVSDSKLFAGPVYEELSAKQVFSGDEDFYRNLEDTPPAESTQPLNAGQIPIVPIRYQRLSSTQKFLAAAIVLIAAVLLYAVLKSPSVPTEQMVSADSRPQAPETSVVETADIIPQEPQKPEQTLDTAQPLSLKVAQSFYLNREYEQAFAVYEKLHESLPVSSDEDLMRDFLQLKMALCMERTADYTQATRFLRKVLNSKSPVVRVVAYFHYSLLEMHKKQYLSARTKAYQAIALIDTIDFDRNWLLTLKRDCYFLAAEAMTKKALSFSDTDKDIPENLWVNFGAADELFIQLDETQLRTFLNSGSQQLNSAVVSPQIRPFDDADGLARYGVTCNGAPIEELLARFTSDSDIDIHWDLTADEIDIRQRLIYLYLPSATTQQFVTVAAGCAGLLARIDEKSVVDIFNPVKYSYMSEHISFLNEDAISLWQKFTLRFPKDERLANVHFALGLLQTQQDRFDETIAEYKLIANRFSRSSLAPFALLNSSKLKNSLQDYSGACQDLKQLVELYPDEEITTKAYLYLADTMAKTESKAEAARLYGKVYHLSFSLESRIASALGAGRSLYEIEDYESTVKWLTRYLTLANDAGSEDLYSAHFLLVKTYLALGNTEAACDAFQYVLQGGMAQLAKEKYVDAVSALVEAYMQKGNFVQALDMLENIYSVALSQKESIEILLLKSRALRAMGLIDKAIAILGDRAEYIPDPQLKAQVRFELCECYIERGNLNIAYKNMAEILVNIKPGLLAYEVALKLSDVCLELDHDSQAAFVCLQLLELKPPEQIKQKALALLAKAYNHQKDYNKAALALLGQW